MILDFDFTNFKFKHAVLRWCEGNYLKIIKYETKVIREKRAWLIVTHKYTYVLSVNELMQGNEQFLIILTTCD